MSPNSQRFQTCRLVKKKICHCKESLLGWTFLKFVRPASLEPLGVRRHYVPHFNPILHGGVKRTPPGSFLTVALRAMHQMS